MNETHDFDILSPGFHANPFPTLDRMRAAGPDGPCEAADFRTDVARGHA